MDAIALATTMKKTLALRTLAEILDGLLSADADPGLTDDEAAAASELFDAIAEACPEAVTEAQSI